MKRLLAYLFIVLGLGLMFNVNGIAEENKKIYKARICGENKKWDNSAVKWVTAENEYSEILIFKDRGLSCRSIMNEAFDEITYKKYTKILKDPDKYYFPFRSDITNGRALRNHICLNKEKDRISNLNARCNNSQIQLTAVGGKDIYLFLSPVSKKESSQTVDKDIETSVVLEMVAKVISPEYSDSGQHTTAFNFSHRTRLNLNDQKAIDKLYKYVFNNTIDRCKSLNKTFRGGICTVTAIRFTDLNNDRNNRSIVNKEGFRLSASLFQLLNENAVQIAELPNTESTELPDKSSEEKRKIEEEKRKIEEEKRKIEAEKKKIAEAKKKQEEEERKRKEANAKLYVIGSGTGFFVSSAGHAVSNEHVVGICKKVATKIEGEKVFFNILKTDKVNDIGLIKGDYKSSSFLNIKSDGAEFGEDIVAFGYPLSDKLSSSVKLSRGIVSSLSGPNDNYSEIQIDAAIQPGNSGGPVLNMEGQVVGIASSGLNKVLMLLDEDQPYIPENINFAVAAPTLLNFLKSNGVTTKSEALVINNTKELAKIGRPATIQLFCLNTKAKYEELKKKKKHNNVLLEKVVELN